MAEALARLHSLDPTSAGLEGYGAPASYCARQLERWARQYASSTSLPAPGMLRIADWLRRHVPAADAAPGPGSVVHGDYRLDNLVFSRGATGGELLAVRPL